MSAAPILPPKQAQKSKSKNVQSDRILISWQNLIKIGQKASEPKYVCPSNMDQISKVKPNMGVGSTFFILAITWPNIFKWNQYYLVFDAPEIPYVCPWLRIKWSKFQTLEKKKTAVNNVKSINLQQRHQERRN